jgi:Predicted acetyltransferase
MSAAILTEAPVRVREFTASPEDYETASRIRCAVYPEYPETAGEIRWSDEHQDPKCKWQRFFAERDGRVVGSGSYGQSSGMYHPRKFYVEVNVLPEYRGQGVGTVLYRHVLEALEPFDPIELHTDAREDDAPRLRYLARAGFTEKMRESESVIDVTAFDPADFREDVAKVEAQGIMVRPFSELDAEDPGARRKLHDLHWAVVQDIPHPDAITQVPFDVWVKRFESPNFLPEGNIVALDGDRYVGTSVLYRSSDPDLLDTGMTGVRREYRKRGIATAMKVRALAYARQYGVSKVRTCNEQNNKGMLGINYRLGFKPTPAWIMMHKVLKEEHE